MREFWDVGKGLYFLFLSSILAIIAGVILIIPVLGVIVGLVLSIVVLVMNLYGLHLMAQSVSDYQTAFYCTIIALVVDLLNAFLEIGLLEIVSSILNLVVVYVVCTVTAGLLDGMAGNWNAKEVAQRGIQVWKINLDCTIVVVVCSLLLFIPVINVFSAVVMLVTVVVSLIGGILYLIFLWKSQQILQSC